MTDPASREEDFTVIDRHLIRSVIPVRGKPYEHRCTQQSFESVAHAVDQFSEEIADPGFTLEELASATGLPHTQVAVALAFLKERGCVTTRFRRNYAASRCAFEDAMIEFHALSEKAAQ